MLLSLFSRWLRLMITGVVCSLPLYLKYMMTLNNNIIIFISLLIFVSVIGFDAYRFSYMFWKKRDYLLGQILPLLTYIITAYLTCMVFKPIVFNRIFLPLKFAECFGMKNVVSIGIVSAVLMIIVTILSFFGARAGYLYYRTFESEFGN